MPIPEGITRAHVLAALGALERGTPHAFGESTKFDLVFRDQRYPPKAVLGLAAQIATGQSFGPKNFSGGESSSQANARLRALGFEIVSKDEETNEPPHWAFSGEGKRRFEAWVSIGRPDPVDPVAPTALREADLYGGAQGIFVGREFTASPEYPDGLTVSLIHTETDFPDELSAAGLIYHYPETRRLGGRNASEIQATKNTETAGIPVLLIVRPKPSSPIRHVRWTFLEGFDDASKQFFFRYQPPGGSTPPSEESFQPTTARNARTRLAKTRPGQTRFRFQVFLRYGPRCSVCDLAVTELLEAAHLVAKEFNGCDDPRNGLVLCRNHHAALDRGFFRIHPETLELTSAAGSTLAGLGITRPSLHHLTQKPAPEALAIRFSTEN